jgi:hypothetical protein
MHFNYRNGICIHFTFLKCCIVVSADNYRSGYGSIIWLAFVVVETLVLFFF